MSDKAEQPKVGFVSLGCPKALVDSERIITDLKGTGYDIVGQYDEADLVVVNTCGFIDEAKAESLSAIQEALHENGKVVVTGCLGKEKEVIQSQFPDVLAVTGPQSYAAVKTAVERYLPKPTVDEDFNPYIDLVPPQGVRLTPPHYAYLKISEGCNHKCTFCIIPSMRGKLVSRPIDDVMTEAENLVDAGVKELLVISQDTSAYGADLKYKTTFWQGRPLKTQFQTLCDTLGELGVWVRLHYVYPYPHVDDIIPFMAEGRILPYLDIPFQHASYNVLKAMKRPAHSENVLQGIEKWRSICPDITLRSTFIVGFPGETEQDFQTLLDFMQEAQLDRVGCFKYSPVEGAVANQIANPVSDEVKQERYDRFMTLQSEISQKKLQNKVGKTLPVIVDYVEDAQLVCRSQADAPEIDGRVYVDLEGDSLDQVPGEGDMLRVEITDSAEHDLWARFAD